jgi:hypothetical protein
MSPKTCFGTPQQQRGVNAYRFANQYKLRHVQTPFSQFKLGHESLSLADPLTKFSLGDAGVLASLHQQLDHSLIEVGSK